MELNELPGSELILPGLEDLAQGKNNTIGALLIAIASIRLTQAGLDIPKVPLVAEPELALYESLKSDGLRSTYARWAESNGHRNDPYSYYNALLNSLNSFCNALELKSSHDTK